jgi:hypothetical protein
MVNMIDENEEYLIKDYSEPSVNTSSLSQALYLTFPDWNPKDNHLGCVFMSKGNLTLGIGQANDKSYAGFITEEGTLSLSSADIYPREILFTTNNHIDFNDVITKLKDFFLNRSNSEITIGVFLKFLEQDLNENTITLDTNLMDYVQTLVQGVEVNLELPLLDEADE